MTAELTFVDTNVLLYAHDRAAGRKREIAAELLQHLWDTRSGATSTQVLQEFYVNATRKLPKPLSAPRARAVIGRYATWRVHRVEPSDIIAASDLERRHRQSFWDALVIVSAARIGAQRLVSEDMQHGRRIADMEIVDPFR
ncbi:MAG: PIN domain-containing protein [Candidatus Limnocylindrales bacterium]